MRPRYYILIGLLAFAAFIMYILLKETKSPSLISAVDVGR